MHTHNISSMECAVYVLCMYYVITYYTFVITYPTGSNSNQTE